MEQRRFYLSRYDWPVLNGLVLRHGWSGSFLLLRQISDQGFGSQDHRGDAGGILQCRAGHLGRIDDSRLDHVLVLISEHIVAILITLMLFLSTAHTLNNDRTIFTTIDHKLAQRLFKRAAQNTDTCCRITC